MTAREGSARPFRLVALFPELLAPGGVQLAGRMLASALSEIASRRKCSLEILSLNDPPGTHELPGESGSIPFRGFSRAKARFVYRALAAARKGAQGDTRIVLAAHPNLAVPASWMRKAAPGLRTIVVSHGIEVWQPMMSSRKRALNNANLVVAPSSYTAKKLSEIQALAPEKIRRLPWPVDPAFLKLAEASGILPVPRGFPQGRVVLTVGRWAVSERYKGADQLISAVARLSGNYPEVRLVIVGTGDDLPRLRAVAAESGAFDRIHFLEGLSREEVAGCYARAEVFALPSTGEGFGLVFLEAMAFAKPVIGVAAGGIPDLIEDGKNGFLLPDQDAEKLAAAIESLMKDDSQRREMGRRGTEKVRKEFRFDTFRENVEDVLLSACESK